MAIISVGEGFWFVLICVSMDTQKIKYKELQGKPYKNLPMDSYR